MELAVDITVGNDSLITFKSGEEVNNAIEIDASFSASHMDATVSGSAGYCHKSQYTHDMQ